MRCPSSRNSKLLLFPLLFPAPLLARAEDALKPLPPKRWEIMDYGPFLSATVSAPEPKQNVAMKGIAIKLGTEADAAVCFDTDLLRMSAGWTGGFLNLTGAALDGDLGPNPSTRGELVFATAPRPGWARNGNFQDPRPRPFGPLPADWAKYKGLYVHGDQVVLSYTVGDCAILELPGVIAREDRRAITRAFHMGKSSAPLALLVCERKGEKGGVGPPSAGLGREKTGPAADAAVAGLAAAAGEPGPMLTAAGLVGAPPGAAWEITDEGRILLKLPPLSATIRFTLAVWSGPADSLPAFDALLQTAPPPPDLEAICKGGPPRWDPPVVRTGIRVQDSAPYVVDNLNPPFENPWHSWLRFGGHDFFSDGRAAICTWSGDVWTVSGIDADLRELTWKRFATGLHQPLGLRIVEDTVYALGRDQITRLRDLNGDGEADFYENFNNDGVVTPSFHEFTTGLDTDPDGNFYYVKGGAVGRSGSGFERVEAHHGCVLKVSRDGGALEVLATGLRAPNGLGVGPHGEVTCGDNEGSWTPACRLNLVSRGGFYGTIPNSHRTPTPTGYDRPLCWFPKRVDNSSGGQVWVASDSWGPFAGRLLHTSYGTCRLFLVLSERVDDVVQGAVAPFPLGFESGIMRGRFHPRDGQLYVSGLKGWQTSGAKDAAFQRVRYTGKPVHMPTALNVTRAGIDLTFTGPLDPSTAGDPQNWEGEQWNYKWTPRYGSPDYKVSDPEKEGRDPLNIASAALSPDGRTVSLSIPGLRPVMQYRLAFKIQAADGTPVRYELVGTLHRVPE